MLSRSLFSIQRFAQRTTQRVCIRPSVTISAVPLPRRAGLATAAPAVSAAMVKVLRDRTGAGLMDCKQALTANADAPNEEERMTRAAEWLRKKGVSVAQKKSGRLAAQGLVGLVLSPLNAPHSAAALVEVNSETDFVARNARFQRLVADIALSALALPSTAADPKSNLIPTATISAAPLWNNKSKTVGDAVLDAIGSIKENLQIRRVARITTASGSGGSVFGYVHSLVEKADPTTADAQIVATDSKEVQSVVMGRIGSIVSLAAATGKSPAAAEINSLGSALTMHIVASSPSHLIRSDVPESAIAKERELIRATAATEHEKKSAAAVASGKPALPELKAAALDRSVDGKLKKWLTEQILSEQSFISPDSNGSDTVGNVLNKAGVEARGFARFSVGEGLNPLGAATDK